MSEVPRSCFRKKARGSSVLYHNFLNKKHLTLCGFEKSPSCCCTKPGVRNSQSITRCLTAIGDKKRKALPPDRALRSPVVCNHGEFCIATNSAGPYRLPAKNRDAKKGGHSTNLPSYFLFLFLAFFFLAFFFAVFFLAFFFFAIMLHLLSAD